MSQSKFFPLLGFLLANFGGLALGAAGMGEGPKSNWYLSLEQAPWTPPGWVFGAAWFTIMLCFSVYLALLWKQPAVRSKLGLLFALQWVLQVAWNPVFFGAHQSGWGLAILSMLLLTIGFTSLHFFKQFRLQSLWVMPYLCWLAIAWSLNAYIFWSN